MSELSPDALIAPWLSERAPASLWVIGRTLPLIVEDYRAHQDCQVDLLSPADLADWTLATPDAALWAETLDTPEQLTALGVLRNRLIGNIFCLVSEQISTEALFALGFRRGENCHVQDQVVLSFHYTLATYNHTRAWNNPKFWANPENWNKYWW